MKHGRVLKEGATAEVVQAYTDSVGENAKKKAA
jgi:hypothetical protein